MAVLLCLRFSSIIIVMFPILSLICSDIASPPFNVMLKREKVEALEAKLKAQGKTKADWLNEKVDEELSK